jgi:iron-sulfur cluster assembly protein|tara:strand:+ start:6726 stop:7112 length:387 start_codon:yes stop_codon:yes gene_type:complete
MKKIMINKSKEISNNIVDYLTISDEALTQIKKLLKDRKEKCHGVRVGVRTRGCSGLSYTIEYAIKDKNITKFDDVIIADKINIFIDPKISMFLIGSEMIYKEDDLESGFDFVNPNEKGRCGCGESFKV